MTSLTLPSIFDLSPLDLANQQILAEIERAEQQIKEEIFIAGVQVGKMIGREEAKRAVLQSNNERLRGEIELLSTAHAQELKTVVNSWEAKRSLVLEKFNQVIGAFNKYAKQSTQIHCGAPLIHVVPSFQRLMDSIHPFNHEAVKTEEEPSPPKNELAVAPCFSLDRAMPLSSTMQRALQLQEEEFQGLKKEIQFLEATNSELLEKKERMILQHGPLLTQIEEKLKNQLALSKMIETARSILSQVDWKFRGVDADKCSNCHFPSRHYTPTSRRYKHNEKQEKNIQKFQQLETKVTKMIASLEHI